MKTIIFPVMNVKMVPASKIVANDYNPNNVASPEFKLLIKSIEADGVTQPVVTYRDVEHDQWIIVDGFHRFKVLRDHFGCTEIPIVEIDKSLNERMASTIRHNRARGSHQVDGMSSILIKMLQAGWSDIEIAKNLGMDADEIIRLKQVCGIAEVFKGKQYNRSWE